MQPTPSDVHVNQPITAISIAFLQDQKEFIAGRAAPIIPSSKQGNVYFEFPRGNWFRSAAKKRGLSQESAGSGFEVINTPYFADVIALHKDLDDQLTSNEDEPLNLDAAAGEFVTRGLLLRREIDWATKFFTTSVWTGAADFVPPTKWDASGSTPIKEIRTRQTLIKEATGFRPNKLILAEDVWAALQDNDDFLNRIAITRDKTVTTNLLEGVLGLNQVPGGEVMIAGAVQNLAVEGATSDDLQFIMKNKALLAYVPDRPTKMAPSAMYTFTWNGYLGAGRDGMRILRFRMQQLRSDRVEGEMAYDQKLVASDLGALFTSVLT